MPAQLPETEVLEEIVSELYRGILQREPDTKWLSAHVANLRKKGITGGVSDLAQHFVATDEFRKTFTGQAALAKEILINSSRVHLRKAIEDFAQSLVPGSLLLDVGAGDAPYKYLFGNVRYESVDFQKVDKKYAKSTYVADICEHIPVESGRFDYILFTQTLEHLKEPARALIELQRVLRPGGKILCTAPLFYEEHEIPYDFFRYTQYGLRHLFQSAGFEIEKIDWLEGLFGTFGYMMQLVFKFVPRRIEGTGEDVTSANVFLNAIRPLALWASGMFYKLDVMYKITNIGFPKNFSVLARKPL